MALTSLVFDAIAQVLAGQDHVSVSSATASTRIWNRPGEPAAFHGAVQVPGTVRLEVPMAPSIVARLRLAI